MLINLYLFIKMLANSLSLGWQIALAGLIVLVITSFGYILRNFIQFLFIKAYGFLINKNITTKVSEKNKNSFNFFLFFWQLFKAIDIFLYFTLAIRFVIASFSLSVFEIRVIEAGLIIVGTFFITTKVQQTVFCAIDKNFLKRSKNQARDNRGRLDPSLVNLGKYVITITIWLFAIINLLQSFEVNLTAILGGLGITGIAVAFALQNLLGDLFASLGLYTDQPFRTGDFISIGNESGTVEVIGLRTTKIRTLTGDLLIYNNRKLIEAEVHNIELMNRRRIVINFGLEYGLKKQQVEQVLLECEKLAKRCGDFDRVHFFRHGVYSLDFELVYYINSGNYLKYMDSLQEVNLGLMEIMERLNLKMAFPTQTLQIQK